MNNVAFVDPSYENFLMHYGTLGQKKGVRNYENYDGTLTPAGKERYSVYWKNGKNLSGKRVHYGNELPAGRGRTGSSEKPEVSRSILDYQKPDGSLTAEGKRKYGDILTEKEMKNLVRNYNQANGTNYRVGDVSFRKNGKLYSAEGKRVDEDVELRKLDAMPQYTKRGLFGRKKELKLDEKIQNIRAMSDEDLKRGIERHKLEKAYMEELGVRRSAGEKFFDSLKSDAATAVTEATKQAIKEAGNAFLKNYVIPKIAEKTGAKPEELKKGFDEFQKKVDTAMQADKAKQQTQQQTQQSQQNVTKLSKPVEQTSSNDLKSFIKSTRKDIPADKVDKMGRNDLEQIARKQLGSSNGGNTASTQTNETKPEPPSVPGSALKRERFSGVAPRTADSYSPTYNPRPVEYWTREQLKNYIGNARGYSDSEQRKILDDKNTDELMSLVRKMKESD